MKFTDWSSNMNLHGHILEEEEEEPCATGQSSEMNGRDIRLGGQQCFATYNYKTKKTQTTQLALTY